MFLILIPQLKEQWILFRNTPLHPLQSYISIINLPTLLGNIKIQGIWIYVVTNTIFQLVY